MGKRLHIKCESCGYDKIIMSGAGLRSRDPEIVRNALAGKDKAKWDELVEQGNIYKFATNYSAGHCSKCDELKNVYKVACVTGDGEEIILGMECETCGEQLIEVSLNGKVKCPLCSKGYLQIAVIGMWD